MPTPTNPAIQATSGPGFYGLAGLASSPKGTNFFLGDILPAFSGAGWNVDTGAQFALVNGAANTESLATLTSRDPRNRNNYVDGANQTTCFITPGGGATALQYQINGGAQYAGGYGGADPTALVDWVDYQTLEVVAVIAGATVVTTFSLVSNGTVGNVVYSKAGATDYYKDYGGNYWYKTGGVWGSDAVADASIVAAFNTYFGVTPAGGYLAYYVLTDGTFLVWTDPNAGTPLFTWIQNGVTTAFPPAQLPSGGVAYYNAGVPLISSTSGFGNGQLNFDGADYSTLTTNVINYGIGGGPPPDPPEWTPPTPVPPPVPPDPGRIIPPREIPQFRLTNISHETSGNY